MKQYYLGIDGGGTKTVFALCDAEGNILAEQNAGSADYRQTGIEGLKKLLTDGTAKLQDKLIRKDPGAEAFLGGPAAPGTIPRLAGVLEGVGVGVPNYTEVAAMDALVDALVGTVFPRERTRIVNDSEAGWAGSLAMEPGINLVSGTGSISFGKNAEGRSASVGGWSDFFSDEGSCHWLGMKCLELFSKQSDGRLPEGALCRIVREHFALQRDKDLIQLVDTAYRQHRAGIASLQRLLAEAARSGDEAAMDAYRQAADELMMIVKATAVELGLRGEVRVACSGGLFNRRSPILPLMKQKLDENGMIWIRPHFPPHLGAVLLAADHAGHTEAVKKMKGKWEDVYNRT